ncbi:MAG: cytochrome c [Burkholderiaceae bacterium]|jgi:mono/diheme cytochrome c family protein|nr:cytochrome c [Burkholderiaceae bacterium]MEB2320137.1 cytochrome c [Pseudomonadota bacterium]
MKSKSFAFALGGGLLLLAAAGTLHLFLTDAGLEPSPAHALRPGDPRILEIGERVYVQQCAACHGASGEGQPDWRERGPDGLLPAPPHDASGHTWHHPDEQLFDITKYGIPRVIGQPDYRTAMPVYEGVLSDEEIIAALSWIKAQWPPEIRRQHDGINARHRESSRR